MSAQRVFIRTAHPARPSRVLILAEYLDRELVQSVHTYIHCPLYVRLSQDKTNITPNPPIRC